MHLYKKILEELFKFNKTVKVKLLFLNYEAYNS